MSQTQQQQPTPKQPGPQNLSTKDVAYLKDHLSWELLAAKKYFHYANTLSPEAVKQGFKDLLLKLGKQHQAHYEQLLNYLKGAAGNVGVLAQAGQQQGVQPQQPTVGGPS